MNDETLKSKETEKTIEPDADSPAEIKEFSADDASEDIQSEEISPRRKALIISAIVAACLLLIVGYFYFERNKSGEIAADSTTEKKEEVVVSVKVAKAEKQPISNEYKAVGTVAPAEQSTVAASISAQISQMRLLKNQFVRQGEVLAILASNDLSAQRGEANAALEEAKLNLQTLQKVTIPQTAAQNQKDAADAQANADNARTVYERRKDLYAKGGLSLKELEASGLALKNAENARRLTEQNAKLNASAVNPNARAIAESKIKQAQTRVNTIDVQKNLAEIRAPISGIVTDQFQFQGEYAAAGAKLLTISDTGAVIVKANFADTVVANLQTGDAVSIFLPFAPDERMGGKITQISRSADPQNRTVEVWANFGNGRGLLRTGDAVQFVVSANPTADALVVPVSAVTLETSNADEGTVMTVDKDDIAHETKVVVGIKSGGLIQIVEGLEEGATVITEGNYALPDGTKIEVQKDAQEGEN